MERQQGAPGKRQRRAIAAAHTHVATRSRRRKSSRDLRSPAAQQRFNPGDSDIGDRWCLVKLAKAGQRYVGLAK
jgi:hypothetical protein